MKVWVVTTNSEDALGVFTSEEEAIRGMIEDNNDSVYPDEKHEYWGGCRGWEEMLLRYLYCLDSFELVGDVIVEDMVVDRKVLVGWDDEGKFEYSLGKDVRLNDLAMFSLHLGRMALGLSPTLRKSPWSTVDD